MNEYCVQCELNVHLACSNKILIFLAIFYLQYMFCAIQGLSIVFDRWVHNYCYLFYSVHKKGNYIVHAP